MVDLLVRGSSSQFPEPARLLRLCPGKGPATDNQPQAVAGVTKGSQATQTQQTPVPAFNRKMTTKKQNLGEIKSQVVLKDVWGWSSKLTRSGSHDISPSALQFSSQSPLHSRGNSYTTDKERSEVLHEFRTELIFPCPTISPSTQFPKSLLLYAGPLYLRQIVTYQPRPGRRAGPVSGGHRPS